MRRRQRVVRVATDEVVSQGEGTWIEIPRKLSTERHLAPVMELLHWQDDPRLATQDSGEMLDLLREMETDFGRVLWRAVEAWNWVTDMEAEVTGVVVPGDEVGVLRIGLMSPIWAGSEFCQVDAEGGLVPPAFADGQPVYVGQYPEEYEVLALREVAEAGRVLVVAGELVRSLVPGEDYVIVGYPQPRGPEALQWCSLEELTFIGNAVSAHFNAGMEARRSKGPKVRR